MKRIAGSHPSLSVSLKSSYPAKRPNADLRNCAKPAGAHDRTHLHQDLVMRETTSAVNLPRTLRCPDGIQQASRVTSVTI